MAPENMKRAFQNHVKLNQPIGSLLFDAIQAGAGWQQYWDKLTMKEGIVNLSIKEIRKCIFSNYKQLYFLWKKFLSHVFGMRVVLCNVHQALLFLFLRKWEYSNTRLRRWALVRTL